MAASPLFAFCLATLWSLGRCTVTPSAADRPPRIVEHPTDTAVPRGSPAMLNCQAEGSPQPKIHWLKDGEPVKEVPSSPTWMVLPSGLFSLAVSRADAGRYRCVAINRAGRATSREATLRAAVLREEFRVSPVDTEASVGSRVTLRCSPPKGDPPPTIGWQRNDKQIDFNAPNSRFSLAGEGDLVITNVTLRDTGHYACVARNYAKMKRRSRVVWLAINELPPPPASVTVQPVDSSSALVTWESPGGPEVTPPAPDGYQVYARSATGHRSRLHADADSTQVTLSNLTAGATYTVWVTSLSPSGESAPSPPVALNLPSSLAGEIPVPKHHRSPSVSLHLPAPPSGATPAPEHRRSPSVALHLPSPSTSVTSAPEHHSSPTADPAADPAGGQRRPRPGHIWLAAAVSALVLLTLTGLAISGWVRHLRGKQQTESTDEKRRDGVSLLPSSVRPASWMEGGVWSSELTGRRAERSCLPPSARPGDGLMDSGAAPSPYATTALLQPGNDDSWLDSCRKSREITSSFSVLPVRGNSRSSTESVLYSRPHRSPCGEDARTPTLHQGQDEQTAELGVMPCGLPFECQSVTRAPIDVSWRASGRQRGSRDFCQPLLGGAPCRGGEGCEAASRQPRHLSFIGEGVVSPERSDIYRDDGGDICRQNSEAISPECGSRASARY